MNKFILNDDEKKYLGFFTDKLTHNYTTNKSQQINYFYLDCEFVITDLGEELAIIAIGNPETKQDYVIKVKPKGQVIDWITNITGLDDKILGSWDMEFDELIEFLKSLIAEDDVLIGHHLYNDLTKLNWSHSNIIDTCFMFPTPDGPPNYYSLKKLAQMYLKKTIQVSTHSALEDAKTAYELVNLAYTNKYLKVNWTKIGESVELDKTNCVGLIIQTLGIDESKLYCIYTRGSRAVGTSKFNSDYDLVVICDKSCGIINGTLTRCANIDICIYDTVEFEKYIEFQYIWVLECICCPKNLIYLELIDFRKIALTYRNNNYNKTLSNDYLSRSIGYETGRKIASSKKHYLNKDFHQAKKHIFIAFRFIDYGIQILTYGYIKNLRNCNFVWAGLLGLGTNTDYETFKTNWYNNYIIQSKQLYKLIGKPINPNSNLKLYNHISFQRNFNFELLIIKFIMGQKINEFLKSCPNHTGIYNNVIKLYGILEKKIHQIYQEIISKNIITGKKDFSEILNGYLKYYHKYLYLLYENKSINLEELKFKPNKIYSDIFGKKSVNMSNTIYKPIPKKEWIEFQNLNSQKVIDYCVFDIYSIRYIGGFDISFDKNDDSKACGFLSVWDCVEKKIVWEDHIVAILDIPYVSGFLGFREIGLYKKLLNRLESSSVQYYPQVLFVDGNGILHHRGFGSASHIGLEFDLPTVGIAKTLLYHDGLDEFVVKSNFRMNCKSKGDWIDLIGKTGKHYGIGLKTSDDSINPIYVSVGHKISIDVARELVIKTCIYKNPEPIRNSDSKSKLYL
jgi:deoxyinosine 3'endonuclease (endonuclease V)/DNA polymerase III epsilon subunit-like protein